MSAATATDRDHRDHLQDMTSSAERARYAAAVTGRDRPGDLVAWLAEHGHEISAESIRSALRRQRTPRGTDHDLIAI